jgi:hypothetical protein
MKSWSILLILAFPTVFANGVNDKIVITKAQYLENSSCEGSGIASYVGVGTVAVLLSDQTESVGYYCDAVKVRVLSNTDSSIIAATVGCEGWAINDNYIKSPLSDCWTTPVTDPDPDPSPAGQVVYKCTGCRYTCAGNPPTRCQFCGYYDIGAGQWSYGGWYACPN